MVAVDGNDGTGGNRRRSRGGFYGSGKGAEHGRGLFTETGNFPSPEKETEGNEGTDQEDDVFDGKREKGKVSG